MSVKIQSVRDCAKVPMNGPGRANWSVWFCEGGAACPLRSGMLTRSLPLISPCGLPAAVSRAATLAAWVPSRAKHSSFPWNECAGARVLSAPHRCVRAGRYTDLRTRSLLRTGLVFAFRPGGRCWSAPHRCVCAGQCGPDKQVPPANGFGFARDEKKRLRLGNRTTRRSSL
jgi:hypothetical protein